MASSYRSEYPSGIAVDAGIQEFFEKFYDISDTPNIHEKYVNSFTKDATFILATKVSKGHDEILATRAGMWAKVASRKHTPLKIFPFGSNATEVMIYGLVAYTLTDGRKADVEWAARAEMAKDEEGWKMKFYQVYLDTAAAQNAK